MCLHKFLAFSFYCCSSSSCRTEFTALILELIYWMLCCKVMYNKIFISWWLRYLSIALYTFTSEATPMNSKLWWFSKFIVMLCCKVMYNKIFIPWWLRYLSIALHVHERSRKLKRKKNTISVGIYLHIVFRYFSNICV